jgi:hypothetical protein
VKNAGHPPIHPRAQAPRRWYCSELEIAACVHAGLLTVSPYLRGITPIQAHYLMTAAGWRPVDLQSLN